jgi:hypothetical protein
VPSHLILFEEHLLRTALTQFQEYYDEERNRQVKNNVLLFRAPLHLTRSPTCHPLSRTSWRPTPILQSRRMNILTKRDIELKMMLRSRALRHVLQTE